MNTVAVAERAYGVRVDIAKLGWHYGDGRLRRVK